MKTKHILLLGLVLPNLVFAQGSLTPPGAPAPVMKTLDQVEPRTPVDATHTPGNSDSVFRIAQSGSYYLSGNITGVASKHAIQIAASNVTLDLSGFRILSAGIDGINVSGAQSNITIRNGSIRTSAGDGIDAAGATNLRIQDVTSRNNTGDGFVVGPDSMLMNCIATNNIGNGLNAADNTTVTNCIVRENGGVGLDVDNNSVVSHSTARENAGHGIATDANCTVSDSSFLLNGGHGLSAGLGNSITNCTARENVGSGIIASSAAVVRGCAARFNDTNGISVGDESMVTECSAANNGGIGIVADNLVTIQGCAASSNGSHGVETGLHAAVARCNTISNTGDGIRVLAGCSVNENNSNNNGANGDGAGIHALGTANRIDSNNVTLNDRGIDVDIQRSVIVRNSAASNTDNYGAIHPSNDIGPISIASTATSPWANISY